MRVERKLQTRIKSFYVPKKLRNDDEAGNSSPGGFFFFLQCGIFQSMLDVHLKLVQISKTALKYSFVLFRNK